MTNMPPTYGSLHESVASVYPSDDEALLAHELTLEHEKVLVLRILAGDEAAFNDFYLRCVPRLFRFIYYTFGGNKEDAEDVLQETMLAAVRSLRRFQGNSSLYTWLYAIARRKISDHIRRKQRHQGSLSEDTVINLAEPSASPEDTVVQRQTVEAVLRALPPDYRAVLLGKYLEGFSVKELARIMGRSEKSVESLLTRARQAFRSQLESVGPDVVR